MAEDEGDAESAPLERHRTNGPDELIGEHSATLEKMGEDSGIEEVLLGFLDGTHALPYVARKLSHLVADSYDVPYFPNEWERRIVEGAFTLLLASLRKALRENE